jgi:hypothetical protein
MQNAKSKCKIKMQNQVWHCAAGVCTLNASVAAYAVPAGARVLTPAGTAAHFQHTQQAHVAHI